jgi:UDP-N-acetylmuramate--alanine ligase
MRRRVQHVHFVGIGGVGMSGIAELLHNQGYRVTGSDLREGAATARLRELGVGVHIGHGASQLGDADVVVYSSAVRATNPELRAAHASGRIVIPRAEMLAEVMRLKEGVAVAGSHGKTTTTSLIAHVLDCAGLDPTSVIGGRVLAQKGALPGAKLGAGELLVAEADESDGSFLRLAPVVAVITNIDPEHLDHYGSVDALRTAFCDFANRVPFWGLVVLCLDHPGVQAILPQITRRKRTYGFSSQSELVAENVAVAPDRSGMRFDVRLRGEALGRVQLPLFGRHNVWNALAALAVALELEIAFATAAEAIASFHGVERRFETVGRAAGVRVVDDYGHHPAEIRATLGAARQFHEGRVVVAFQPHRYTRTRDLWDEFATAFNDADVLILSEIYSAGEDKLPGVESSELANAIRAHGHRDVRFASDLEAVLAELEREAKRGDLVLTLGAGSISTLARRLVSALAARAGGEAAPPR